MLRIGLRAFQVPIKILVRLQRLQIDQAHRVFAAVVQQIQLALAAKFMHHNCAKSPSTRRFTAHGCSGLIALVARHKGRAVILWLGQAHQAF